MLIHYLAAALSDPLGAPSVVSISDDTSTGARGRTTGVIFSNTGAYYKYINETPIQTSYWITPQVDMGDYEIRATVSSGSTPDAGTIGSWEALSTTRTWELANSTPSTTLTSVLLIEIRWTGNNVVQDSATYTLSAEGPLM